VLDPARAADRATFEQPIAFPEGIHDVFVDGRGRSGAATTPARGPGGSSGAPRSRVPRAPFAARSRRQAAKPPSMVRLAPVTKAASGPGR
jgi:hypothetical protein